MNTDKLIIELSSSDNVNKPDVLAWIDGDLHEIEVDSSVGGQIHLNVYLKEPKEPKTEFTVVLGKCQVAKFKADLTEEQAMILFNISSKKETYSDADGMLEFHCKERSMMIYSNIKA